MDEVDEIIGYGMQAGGQRLVFHDAFELDAGLRGLPRDGIAGLDIEVDEEERGDGGEIGHGDNTGARWESHVELGLATA